MNKRYFCFWVFVLLLSNTSWAQENSGSVIQPFSSVRQYTHPKLQMTVIQAEMELPDGQWQIANYDHLTGLRHVEWEIPMNTYQTSGDRYAQIQNEGVQGHMSGFFWGIQSYSVSHAEYGFIDTDFGAHEESIFQMIKSLTSELNMPVPSLDTNQAALKWLNESILPYQIFIKYMDETQFVYPEYEVVSQIRQKFSNQKLEELDESDLRELADSPLGKRFKRLILIKRFKLSSMPEFSGDRLGPGKIEQLEEYTRAQFYRKPSSYGMGPDQELPDPQFFLVPKVPIVTVDEKERRPLVLELYPFLEDGKHWVLFNNGTSERVEINQELARTYQIQITPVQKLQRTRQTYRLMALVLNSGQSPWIVELKDMFSGASIKVSISLDQAAAGGREVFDQWNLLRAQRWAGYFQIAPSTVYYTWLTRFSKIYGDQPQDGLTGLDNGNRTGRTTSVFNLLGGRAAIEETLQMIDLRVRATGQAQEPGIPLSEINGVTVKAHAYEELLGDNSGGQLTLAEYATTDRFFIYFSEANALVDFLNEGVEFVHQLGGDTADNKLQYDLKNRYYSRLGLNAAWVERFFKSGLVKEVAFLLPDLFIIEGTDITVISQVPNFKLALPLLTLIGLVNLEQGQIVEKTLDDGRKVYWCARGQILMVSTHKNEINRILDLIEKQGQGSLGKSPEFRYMLTQLPLKEQTKVYAYFSDPFIRRMTGPEVKIAQFRRLKERGQLEALTAGALLYAQDGHADQPELNKLISLGYVDESLAQGYTLAENFLAGSEIYGTSADMVTILDMGLTQVSSQEAAAYKEYVDNYSRFWRQFFDPIAIRYDEIPNGGAEIQVFILPLIESSIYNAARDVLNSQEQSRVLLQPVLASKPLLTISANINEKTWVEVVKGFQFLKKFTNLDPAVFDEFGPALHVIIRDADPVINLGSSDFLGLLDVGGPQVFAARESLWMPVVFMMLTRPAQMMFELKNEQNVLGHLRAVSFRHDVPTPRDWWDTRVEFTQIEDRDEWHCRIGLFGVLNLRFGVRVLDGYLMFSNVPWLQSDLVSFAKDEILNNAAISFYPGAANLQLPGLYNSALERMGRTNRHSLVYLEPLSEDESKDIPQVLQRHKQLFGFTPLHAGRGEWQWYNGRLTSSTFGNLSEHRQPVYKPQDRDFGILRQFNEMTVSLQFEDTGLRTKIRWTNR